MGAGTHGSIKSYTYSCEKDSLQKAIMTVIKENPNIFRDTTLDYLGSSPLLDSANCPTCKAGDNFYNDIKHYVTIKITSGQEVNEYTFRYYGSDKDWRKLKTSGVFICYAYDKDGNGGSEGNGGISGSLANRLTKVFEKEFLDQVDRELKLTRTETE